MEDPYWVAHRKYRPLEVWVDIVRKLSSGTVKYKSNFIMSDESSALDSMHTMLAEENLTQDKHVIKD